MNPAPLLPEFDLGLWMMIGMGLVFIIWFCLREDEQIVHDDDDEFDSRPSPEDRARRTPF